MGAIAALTAVTACPNNVFADQLQGTRFEPSEVQHRMQVVVNRGYVELLVERVVFNPGDKADQALYSLDLPEGAVATSLKTLGTLKGQPHWFYGDLKEAEEAARKYQELTGEGGYYPKDPALLSWRSPTNLFLQVFPCMPKQNKALGYTLELPMTYSEGRYRVQLPALGMQEKLATFTVQAAHAGDQLFVDDKAVQAGRTLIWTGEHVLALEPYRATGVAGELAVAGTGLGRTFAHVRYALAKHLSEVPKGAYVVLGIDNSRSMLGYREVAVKMAEGTLRLFPSAQVQILDFDRKPRPRFAEFKPAPFALAALKRELAQVQVPEDGNGSEIDLALSEAERLLANVPVSKPKRILFFTDSLVPERITPADVVASVGKSGAIVHVVNVQTADYNAFERNDTHPWATAARNTGGLVWDAATRLYTGGDDDADGPRPNPYVPLVRPTTLYNAEFSFAEPDEDEKLGDLEEGIGVERQGLYDHAVRWARLSGELWSRPFRLTLHPDPEAGKLWSALVFGTEHREKLNDGEMMVLAKRGGAVSPVTSYLAIEPGVRPSTEGLKWDEVGEAYGVGGLGLSGVGEGGGGSAEGIGLGELPFDPQAFLQEQLASKWAACKGEKGQARVSLETHSVEVADVVVTLDTEESEKFSCIEEAAWSLDLRGRRFNDRVGHWTIEL